MTAYWISTYVEVTDTDKLAAYAELAKPALEGAGGRFIARGIDTHKNLPDVLKRAYANKGTSFVEIYQNCIVYNDGVFESFTEKKNSANTQLWLEHGKPMLFAGGTKGITLNRETLRLEVVDVVDGDVSNVIVHDETNKSVAQMLVEMPFPAFPVAMGVIYADPAPTFETAVVDQNRQLSAGKTADLNALIRKGQTWEVNQKQPHVI